MQVLCFGTGIEGQRNNSRAQRSVWSCKCMTIQIPDVQCVQTLLLGTLLLMTLRAAMISSHNRAIQYVSTPERGVSLLSTITKKLCEGLGESSAQGCIPYIHKDSN